MKKRIYIQIQSEELLIYANNKIIKNKLGNSIKNYQIINKDKFISEFNKIATKEHFYNSLFITSIYVILDDIYSPIELDNLSNILKELSFNRVNIIEPRKILNQENNTILIRLSNSCIIINYYNRTIFIPIYFNKYKEILLIYLKEIIQLIKIDNIKIYGDLANINSISRYIENKLKIKAYIYSYPTFTPLNRIK